VAEAASAPLARKRIVITRAALQSSELVEKLTAAGAIPIALPLITFAPPEDYKPLDAALLAWRTFDWVMFTSAYAVETVLARAARLGRNLAKGAPPPAIAVVGPATRDKASQSGFTVAHTAQTHLGVALAEELGDQVGGKRVLLPRGDRANPDLASGLAKQGAKVTEVVAYCTVRAADAEPEQLARVVRGEAEAILFFSPSAVESFVEAAGKNQLAALQNRVAIAAIGPVTARALRDAGVGQILVAEEATADAVIRGLSLFFSQRSQDHL
jgi:uroporphyrinogen-III synthase